MYKNGGLKMYRRESSFPATFSVKTSDTLTRFVFINYRLHTKIAISNNELYDNVKNSRIKNWHIFLHFLLFFLRCIWTENIKYFQWFKDNISFDNIPVLAIFVITSRHRTQIKHWKFFTLELLYFFYYYCTTRYWKFLVYYTVL